MEGLVGAELEPDSEGEREALPEPDSEGEGEALREPDHKREGGKHIETNQAHRAISLDGENQSVSCAHEGVSCRVERFSFSVDGEYQTSSCSL